MAGELTSINIEMQPLAPGEVNALAGYQAHAAFLEMVRQLDPALSQQLHDTPGRKPFTISSLREKGQTRFSAGLQVSPPRQYYLRLTGLTDPVSRATLAQGQSTPVEVRLGQTVFRVLRLHLVNTRSFQDLQDRPPQSRWHFRFLSPTVFSLGQQPWGGRKFGLFPEPGLVWDSLMGSWSAYAPPGLLELDKMALRQYLESYVVVTGHSLQTAIWPFAHHQQLGFSGTVNFRTMEKSPDPAFTRPLTMLAALAEFAGVGYKTAMGMGQTVLETA